MIDETDRRRAKQIAYNKQCGITPCAMEKAVLDVMAGAYTGAPLPAKKYTRVAVALIEYAALTPVKMTQNIKTLEQPMHTYARNLELEQAAQAGDEIHALQQHQPGLVDKKAG